MKKVLIVVITVVAVILFLSLAKDMVIKGAIQKGTELVTGLKLNMRSFNLGIIRSLVAIKEVKLFNPKGYPDKIMLDIPEIYVDYNLPAIIGGKLHLEKMRINLQEFSVVKNEKGELNLDSLKVVQAQKEGKKPEEKGKAPKIQIDNLELKIGRVIYKDYSRSKTPSVREFDINLNEKYENITDPYSLVSLIVVKALMNTTIASLANFDLGGLKSTVSDTLSSAKKIAGEAASKAQEAAKAGAEKTQEAVQKTAETTQKAAQEAADVLKKTAGDLKDKINLPFGDK